MKIAVFSDTHDNFELIHTAIGRIKELNAELLIHCGDVCAPVTLGEIAEKWGKELHYCFGNVDGDRFLMHKLNADNPRIHHHGEELGFLEVGGRKIAFQHYPKIAHALAVSSEYDAVFYGHDHKKHAEYKGETLLANPGNLCNIKHPPSFGIYETEDNSIEHFDLEV